MEGHEVLWISAREVRVGDRLVVSEVEVVRIEETASGELLLITNTATRTPMPPGQRVWVRRGAHEPER
jgi:hypothetical protein